MCFVKYFNWGVFNWFACGSYNLVPAIPQKRSMIPKHSVSLNAFASNAATSAVILGHTSIDLKFSLTVLLERRYLHYRPFRNLIKAFPFFPRNSGREASQVN